MPETECIANPDTLNIAYIFFLVLDLITHQYYATWPNYRFIEKWNRFLKYLRHDVTVYM